MDDVVAVVTDLFFQSRISSAARVAGRTIRYVTSVEAIGPCRLALVDLDATADVLTLIPALKAQGAERVVAFGPHVDTERRKLAREVGADRVLAKSKFVTELPALLMPSDARGAADGTP